MLNGFAALDQRTVANDTDGNGGGSFPAVRANPLVSDVLTASDDADANDPPQSDVAGNHTCGWRVRA